MAIGALQSRSGGAYPHPQARRRAKTAQTHSGGNHCDFRASFVWFVIYLIAGQNNWSAVAIGLGILIVYIILSFFLEPEPNYENFGWMGGFMDNPFRISDDYNRFLAFLNVILLPGKCMAYGFLFTYQIFRYNILKKSD